MSAYIKQLDPNHMVRTSPVVCENPITHKATDLRRNGRNVQPPRHSQQRVRIRRRLRPRFRRRHQTRQYLLRHHSHLSIWPVRKPFPPYSHSLSPQTSTHPFSFLHTDHPTTPSPGPFNGSPTTKLPPPRRESPSYKKNTASTPQPRSTTRPPSSSSGTA